MAPSAAPRPSPTSPLIRIRARSLSVCFVLSIFRAFGSSDFRPLFFRAFTFRVFVTAWNSGIPSAVRDSVAICFPMSQGRKASETPSTSLFSRRKTPCFRGFSVPIRYKRKNSFDFATLFFGPNFSPLRPRKPASFPAFLHAAFPRLSRAARPIRYKPRNASGFRYALAPIISIVRLT
jgi:hypothetical protein